MIVHDHVQLSPEWCAARCGVPSASNFDKIITTKGEPSKQRQKYLWQLAGEKILGVPEETYTNAAMQRGQELEDEARKLYQLIKDEIVMSVGFCTDNGYGASPDGLIGQNGGLEIKCPTLATHIGYLMDGGLPMEYFQQVQGNLLVTGREWWDFMSYYPNLDPLIIRVERDKKFLTLLRVELDKFKKELDETIEKLKGQHEIL